MTLTVPIAEFADNFDRYRTHALHESIAVSSRGEITGYFVGAKEYEEWQLKRDGRRSFATAELTPAKAELIAASRMDARHAHLDALLDQA